MLSIQHRDLTFESALETTSNTGSFGELFMGIFNLKNGR
jgi:hypothetical protein